jgi:hypothetical protein
MFGNDLLPLTVFSKGKSMKASLSTVQLFGVAAVLAGVGGCATAPIRPGLPSNAMQVSSGGRIVAFTAPQDGKAYLNDDTDKCVVYSTELKRDQVMRFDPDADAVRIDGNTAPEGIANPGHDHSIYFARSPQPANAAAVANLGADANAANSNSPTTIPTVRVPIGIQVDVQPQQPAPK